MFSNSGNFRDLILFVIPGSISLYFGLGLMKLLMASNDFDKVNAHLGNVNFVLLFISLSAVTGYIQSKLLLSVYHALASKVRQDPREIRYALAGSLLKDQVVQKVIIVFGLPADCEVEKNDEIFSFCYHYTAARTDAHSFWYPERLAAYSMFVAVISLPLSFSILFFIFSLQSLLVVKLILTVVLIPLCFWYCFTQSLMLRKEWIKNVYRLFYSVKEGTQENLPVVPVSTV